MAEQEQLISEQILQVPYNYSAGRAASRFLAALRDEKKIYAIVCKRCNIVYCPPRSVCGRCFEGLSHWKEVGPYGVVRNFTRVEYTEDVHPATPLVPALIELDGADTLFPHLIIDTEDVKTGDRVRPVFAENRTGHILDMAGFVRVG